MLYNILKELDGIKPELHLDDHKPEALRKIIAEWVGKSPLVQSVFLGETTFEQEVKPLVEENLRLGKKKDEGHCCSPEFLAMGEEVGKKFNDIMSLDGIDRSPRERWDDTKVMIRWGVYLSVAFCLVMHIFLSPIVTEKDRILFYLLTFIMPVAGFVFLPLLLHKSSTAPYLQNRRRWARGVLENAKFMDRMFDLAKLKT